jgi:hypothetical protein
MNDETTLQLIEDLKKANVCLSLEEPGNQEAGIHDFTDCLPFLGQCNALIFCVPGRTAVGVRNLVLGKHGGVFHGSRIIILDEKSLEARNLFPAQPGWMPSEKRSMENNLWGHYSKVELETVGKRRPLNLLHLGISYEAVSINFLQPQGIQLAGIISNPQYQ